MTAAGRMLGQLGPDDRGRFVDAAVKLLMDLDYEVSKRIGEEFAQMDVAQWGILTCVFFRVLMQHVNQGYPLALPPEVLMVYREAGDQLEMPLFECELCGYCVPRSFRICPLCGGRTGLGAHSLRQQRKAGSN
jgi:hypothetical protein